MESRITFRDGHFIVQSSRRRVAPYSIRHSGTLGRWICNCPDWWNRKIHTGENCKHIKMVVEWLETASMKELEEADNDDESSN